MESLLSLLSSWTEAATQPLLSPVFKAQSTRAFGFCHLHFKALKSIQFSSGCCEDYEGVVVSACEARTQGAEAGASRL